MLGFRSILDFNFSSIIFSTLEVLSSIFSILSVNISSVMPLHLPRFLISSIIEFVLFHFFYLHFQVSTSSVHFLWLLLFSWLSSRDLSILFSILFTFLLPFSKGFIHIFCQNLYHLYKVSFKVLYFFFSCVGVLRTCSRIAANWRGRIALAVVCDLKLASTYPGLWWLWV